MPTLNCPKCESPISIPEEMLNRNGRCPRCRHTFYLKAPPDSAPGSGVAPMDEDDRLFVESWGTVRFALQTLIACSVLALVAGTLAQLLVIYFGAFAGAGPNMTTQLAVSLVGALLFGFVVLVAMAMFCTAPDGRTRFWALLTILSVIATVVASGVAVAGAVGARVDTNALLFIGVVVACVAATTSFVAWIKAHAAIGSAVGDPGVTRAAHRCLIGMIVLMVTAGVVRVLLLANGGPDPAMASIVWAAIDLVVNCLVFVTYISLCRRCLRPLSPAMAATRSRAS